MFIGTTRIKLQCIGQFIKNGITQKKHWAYNVEHTQSFHGQPLTYYVKKVDKHFRESRVDVVISHKYTSCIHQKMNL